MFVTTLRRPLIIRPIEIPVSGGSPSYATLSCVLPRRLDAFLSFDVTLGQTWNLTDLTLGDLASTIALAPGEELTLEFQSTQRKVFDQSTLDSAESIDSVESTAADTESVNVTRASSKTQSWHVDTTGTLTCGYASLSTTVGVSQSVTDSNQQAINHVTSTTRKSAQSLKSMHKIEVRGVSETVVANRMTRTIANPYRDRALSLNVFQLLKHFSVETAVDETRLALIFRIDDLVFDQDFVRTYADFLRSTLLDSSLVDDLPTAIAGAVPPLPATVLEDAIDTAKRALRFLYSYDHSADNMFDVHHIGPPAVDPNAPVESFHANYPGHSGLDDALNNHCAGLFAVLNYFWSVINEPVPDPSGTGTILLVERGDQAVRIATALAAEVRAQWQLLFPDPLKSDELRNLMDQDDLTEIFRRIPGFLTIVEGILQPLLDPAQVERDALKAYQQAQGSLDRLIHHLECNRHYYVERFLRYLHSTTDARSTMDFARSQASMLTALPSGLDLAEQLDFDRTYIDKLEIIVPSFGTLANADVGNILRAIFGPGATDPQDAQPAVLQDLQVPTDGIHLEAAPGACVLPHVPAPSPTVDLSIKGLDFHATSPGKE